MQSITEMTWNIIKNIENVLFNVTILVSQPTFTFCKIIGGTKIKIKMILRFYYYMCFIGKRIFLKFGGRIPLFTG